MLSISATVSIYLYTPATDMRKGVDGLSGLVRQHFGVDPLDGSLFLFVNRRRDRLTFLLAGAHGVHLMSHHLQGLERHHDFIIFAKITHQHENFLCGHDSLLYE
jgi:transposase